MAMNALAFLRSSLGVVFFWFGALKLVPGLSPAEELIRASMSPFVSMPGTFSPVLLRPDLVWTQFPFGLTMAGQYIFKNFVLISAGLVTVNHPQVYAEARQAMRHLRSAASSSQSVRLGEHEQVHTPLS